MMLSTMFTIATPREDSWRSPTLLLFFDSEHSFPGEGELLDEVAEIVKDEAFQKVFPEGAYFRLCVECSGDDDVIIAENPPSKRLIGDMENGNKLTLIHWDPSGGLEVVLLEDVYYSCKNPVRTLMGCQECVKDLEQSRRRSLYDDDEKKEPELPRCRIAHDAYGPVQGSLPAKESLELFQNRRSVMASYTYISPKLTTEDEYVSTKTLRPPSKHNFYSVDENSIKVGDALRERGRRNVFRKSDCNRCPMEDACKKVHGGLTCARWCEGRYIETDEEMLLKLSSRGYWNQWTDPQLLAILSNSGERAKRYKRYITWLTLQKDGSVALKYARTGKVIEEMTDWEDVEYYIKEENEYFDFSVFKDRVVDKTLRGKLAAALYHPESPRIRCTMGSTSYPTIGVSLGYNGTVVTRHINSHGDRLRHPTYTYDSAADLLLYYNNLPGIFTQETSPNKLYGS
jgi:hypothetical protein